VRIELSGTQLVAAPIELTWRNLIDHDFIAAVAPGIESVGMIDDEHFRAIAALGVGSMSLRFALQLRLHDLQPLASVRMSVKGSAPGSAMRAEASASIVSTSSTTTRLDWTVASDVHGTVAGVGARLLQSTARKMTESFWRKFAERTAETAREAAPPA
jgi:carbon monoxide dehydrogenase subunit G